MAPKYADRRYIDGLTVLAEKARRRLQWADLIEAAGCTGTLTLGSMALVAPIDCVDRLDKLG